MQPLNFSLESTSNLLGYGESHFFNLNNNLISKREGKHTYRRLLLRSLSLRKLFSIYQPELLSGTERSSNIATLIYKYLFTKSNEKYRKLIKDEEWVKEVLFINLEGVRMIIKNNDFAIPKQLDHYYSRQRNQLLQISNKLQASLSAPNVKKRQSNEKVFLNKIPLADFYTITKNDSSETMVFLNPKYAMTPY